MVVGIGWLLFGGVFVWFLVMQRHHARRARDAAATPLAGPLRPGPAVIGGRVDDEGAEPAITIGIEQQGSERRNNGSWSHLWRESRREISVRPFYIVRTSGERVRVEPDESVFLVDKLDGIEVRGVATRARTATLVADETVFACGTLTAGFDPKQGGYRDTGSALVLRPTRGSRMLISTEPLAQRHAAAARRDLGFAAVMLAVLLLAHGVLFLRFDALALFGKRVDAEIIGVDTHREPSSSKSSSWEQHYVVYAAKLYDECSADFYRSAKAGTVQRAPFLVAGRFRQIGARPTESIETLRWFIVLSIGFLSLLVSLYRKMRPWWDQPKVIDRGNGRLNESTISLR